VFQLSNHFQLHIFRATFSALFVGCSFLDDSSISVETGGIVVVISQAAETEVPGGEEVGAAVEIAIQSPGK
jgi:hypothetical protein